jgi:hypothetical protein
MTNLRYYRGLDFANRLANRGECLLRDDGETLTAHLGHDQPSTFQVIKTAVDCPFGTTVGFEMALRGEPILDVEDDGFKARVTEHFLRTRAAGFRTTQDWRAREGDDRRDYPRDCYFHPTRHIQPAVGMVIVPQLLHWLANELAPGRGSEERLTQLRMARRGDACIIEAHPRMYLYSAVERIRLCLGVAIPFADLDAVAGYGDAGARGEQFRLTVYQFLQSNTQWMGQNQHRVLAVEGGKRRLVEVDHAFDAWLSALTAWSHDLQETLKWNDVPELRAEIVDVEGHILALR